MIWGHFCKSVIFYLKVYIKKKKKKKKEAMCL